MARGIYVDKNYIYELRRLLDDQDADFLEVYARESDEMLFIGKSLVCVTRALGTRLKPPTACSTQRTAMVDRPLSLPPGDTPSEYNAGDLGDDDLATIDIDTSILPTPAPVSSTSQLPIECGEEIEGVVQASQPPRQNERAGAEGIDEAGDPRMEATPALPRWVTNPPTPPPGPNGNSIAPTKRMKAKARQDEREAAARARKAATTRNLTSSEEQGAYTPLILPKAGRAMAERASHSRKRRIRRAKIKSGIAIPSSSYTTDAETDEERESDSSSDSEADQGDGGRVEGQRRRGDVVSDTTEELGGRLDPEGGSCGAEDSLVTLEGASTNLTREILKRKQHVWLRNQVLSASEYSVRGTTRSMRQLMLNRARDVGGVEVMKDWQNTFETWRRQSPLAAATGLGEARDREGNHLTLDRLQVVTFQEEVRAFYYAVHAVDHSDAIGHTTYVLRRIQLAELHDARMKALRHLSRSDSRPLKVQMDTARAKFFKVAYPELKTISDADKHLYYRKFRDNLKAAGRWYSIREMFGRGIFGLIPASFKTWFEQKLSDAHFELWMRLVAHCHPDCRVFADRCESRLMSCMDKLGAHPLPAKLLSLETASAKDIGERIDKATLLDLASEDETGRFGGDEGWPLSSLGYLDVDVSSELMVLAAQFSGDGEGVVGTRPILTDEVARGEEPSLGYFVGYTVEDDMMAGLSQEMTG